MDTTATRPYSDMLTDLRQKFNHRIPGGLTPAADGRLSRTLTHYISEVDRVGGGNQDILRMTYDSMAKWFRRNLLPTESKPEPVESFNTEVDAATLFASLPDTKTALKAKKPEQKPNPEKPNPEKPKPEQKINPEPFIQQKDVLQPHEDTVKYREVEYNLVMNSKDRNWLQNTTQNRYNFSIQFNTNYKPQGFGLQGNIQNRLRNILRIEFIKAILPVEGLSVVLPKDISGCALQPQNAFYSVLALPSVNVLVDEFTGNNYGTNNNVDKSLAVCQYDATWRSENLHNKPATNRGYALFFPKFMKAQRVYSPTPLSNLQTLSFRLQDPEGDLLSMNADSSVLSSIAFSDTLTGTSCYLDVNGDYIFLQASDWFSLWTYSQLDKILIQGLTFISAQQPAGSAVLNEWLQQTAGHSVVGVAYSADVLNPLTTLTDGVNSVGYANWIIIRNRFVDPTAGSVGLNYFTGTGPGDAELGTDMLTYPQTGGILNLSRQVQLSIRIITREYDLVSNVRADNV